MNCLTSNWRFCANWKSHRSYRSWKHLRKQNVCAVERNRQILNGFHGFHQNFFIYYFNFWELFTQFQSRIVILEQKIDSTLEWAFLWWAFSIKLFSFVIRANTCEWQSICKLLDIAQAINVQNTLISSQKLFVSIEVCKAPSSNQLLCQLFIKHLNSIFNNNNRLHSRWLQYQQL